MQASHYSYCILKTWQVSKNLRGSAPWLPSITSIISSRLVHCQHRWFVQTFHHPPPLSLMALKLIPLDVLERQWQHYTAGYVIWFVVEKPLRSSKPEWIIMRLHKKGPSRHIILIRTYQTPFWLSQLPALFSQSEWSAVESSLWCH